MKIAWATDIHLDHCNDKVRHKFFNSLKEANPDIVLIGGDYGTGDKIEKYLKLIADNISVPVYLVNGNHDHYLSGIAHVREICRNFNRLTYLSTAGVIPLTEITALIGHDSWGDARYGNPYSTVQLNDFHYIADLKIIYNIPELFIQKLRELGDEARDYLSEQLDDAFKKFDNVILLTHVPPFKEVSMFDGKISGDDWLPFFSCKAVGDMLLAKMAKHIDKKVTVLAGHTHHFAEQEMLPNLLVKVGAATYGKPTFEIIDI